MDDLITANLAEESPANLATAKAARERLVEQAMTGDHGALTELCKSIARNVLFRVSCRLRNQMDAEDVAQEILIRVCQKIRGLNDAKAFAGWLNSIIINETNRFLSQDSKQADIVSIDDYDDVEYEEEYRVFLPDEFAIREEDRKMIMDIVKGLPDRQHEAVMLHYYENMNVTETAAAMGISKPNVVRYLALARDKIKNEIENQSKKTGRMYSIGLLPIGALLTQVLKQEAELTAPLSLAPVERALEAPAEELRQAASPLSGTFLYLFFSFIIGVGAVFLMLTGNVFEQPGDAYTDSIVASDAVAIVVFSGGYDGYEHLNPKHAVAQTSSIFGELTELNWRIEDADTGAVLYSGEGSNADDALRDLSVNGEDGEYWIFFSLKDTTDGTYTLSRSFIILKAYM